MTLNRWSAQKVWTALFSLLVSPAIEAITVVNPLLFAVLLSVMELQQARGWLKTSWSLARIRKLSPSHESIRWKLKVKVVPVPSRLKVREIDSPLPNRPMTVPQDDPVLKFEKDVPCPPVQSAALVPKNELNVPSSVILPPVATAPLSVVSSVTPSTRLTVPPDLPSVRSLPAVRMAPASTRFCGVAVRPPLNRETVSAVLPMVVIPVLLSVVAVAPVTSAPPSRFRL